MKFRGDIWYIETQYNKWWSWLKAWSSGWRRIRDLCTQHYYNIFSKHIMKNKKCYFFFMPGPNPLLYRIHCTVSDIFHHMWPVLELSRVPDGSLLTFNVLCRARSVCTFSLMTGFLQRRMNDFLKWSCVNGCLWPIRETPPSFMLFSIMPISSTGAPSEWGEDADGEADKVSVKMQGQSGDG